MLYGLCVKEETMCIDETEDVPRGKVFVDELRGEEKSGCTRDPL
jgi:hypothetical protein